VEVQLQTLLSSARKLHSQAAVLTVSQ
jgi:hypothetical protein